MNCYAKLKKRSPRGTATTRPRKSETLVLNVPPQNDLGCRSVIQSPDVTGQTFAADGGSSPVLAFSIPTSEKPRRREILSAPNTRRSIL